MTKLNKKESSARPNTVRPASHVTRIRNMRYAICNVSSPHLIFWSLMVVGTAMDLWTKSAIFDWLKQKPGNGVSIVGGFLQLVAMENSGAAFGIATGQRYLLITVSALALIVVLAIFLFSATERKLVHVALGLFAAGICGNLWDRIFNDGRVRDFIDVYYHQYHWPAFNIADSMLCIAVGLLIISTLVIGKPSRKPAQQHR